MNVTITIASVIYNGNLFVHDLLNDVRIIKGSINCEFVVIDGGSTDGTLLALREQMDIIDFLVSEPDRGVYDAMNKALRQATGDFVIFFGADDRIEIDNFLRFVEKMKFNDSVYYGLVRKDNKAFGGKTNFWKVLRQNIPHQAVFYPKQIYKRMEYNINYRIQADHEYNIRAYYNNCRFIFQPIIVATFGSGGLSSKNIDINFMNDYYHIVAVNGGLLLSWIIKFGKIAKKFME